MTKPGGGADSAVGGRVLWPAVAAGPADAASMSAVTAADPVGLSGAELVDAIVASEKALSLLAATQMRLLGEFARPGRAGDVTGLVAALVDKGGQGIGADGCVDLDVLDILVADRAVGLAAAEVAAALQISPITAGVRVRKAQDLCEQLPATVTALAAGRIDRGRALLIAERTAPLTAELRAVVEQRVLPLAQTRSTGNLRPLLDRAVIAVDPQAAEKRERKAKRDRELSMRPLPDGMAMLAAYTPAAGAVSIFTLADLLAQHTGKDDDRPVGARRVDAWTDIADQLLTHGQIDLTGLLEHPDHSNTDHSNTDHPDTDTGGERDTNRGGDQRGNSRDGAGGPDGHTADQPRHGAPAVGSAANGGRAFAAEENRGTTGAAAAPVGSTPAGPVPDDAADPGTNGPGLIDAAPADPSTTSPTPADAAPGRPAPVGPAATDPTPGTGDRTGAASAVTCAACGRSPQPQPVGNREHRRASARATRQGRRPQLTVTLSASTLAGLDRLPGHLDGYGAITADTALAIASSAASITTAVLDPATGAITAAGTRIYRPRQAIRDITGTLANTCRFPSCRQPAWRCDLDHHDPFNHTHPDRGGATDEANLGPLCRPHHLLRHHCGWSSTRRADHSHEWISPTRHHYLDPPRALTLPGELLTPTPPPPPTRTATHDPSNPDGDPDRTCPQHPDDDCACPPEGRPDLRDAEFGGPIPDTLPVKIGYHIARNRIDLIRGTTTRPPRTQPATDHQTSDQTNDQTGHRPDSPATTDHREEPHNNPKPTDHPDNEPGPEPEEGPAPDSRPYPASADGSSYL